MPLQACDLHEDFVPVFADNVPCPACKVEAKLSDTVAALVTALEEIRDAEDRCCPRCEGNGTVYADGKAHLLSEGAPTMLCGQCGGGGRLQPENAQDVAAAALLAKEG